MNKLWIIWLLITVFIAINLAFLIKQNYQKEELFVNKIKLPIDRRVIQIASINITYEIQVEKTEPWKEIALNIATSCNYDALKYNCWDYSTDLKRALVKAGYDAKIVLGIVDCNSGLFDYTICKSFAGLHNWVVLKLGNQTIWIEATTGQVIQDENKKYYKLSYPSTEKYNPLKKCLR